MTSDFALSCVGWSNNSTYQRTFKWVWHVSPALIYSSVIWGESLDYSTQLSDTPVSRTAVFADF